MIDDIDVDCDETTMGPPAPLLPLLSLDEAQALLPLLAAVRDGGVPDRETARWLLQNLAARVPSREAEDPAAGDWSDVSARGRAIAAACGTPPRRPLRNPDGR